MNQVAPPRPAQLTALPHSGLTVGEFYSMHFLAGVFPLAAGMMLYGWRAALVVLGVTAAAALALSLWKTVGKRGRQMSYTHALWLAMLLAMMLPAHLAAIRPPAGLTGVPWHLPLAAGLVLVMFLWLLGGQGSGRIHPVLSTYVVLATLFFGLLTPHLVLQRQHLLSGDLLRAPPAGARSLQTEPWASRPPLNGADSQYVDPAGEALTRYTAGRETAPRGWLPIQSLLRDELPDLDDFILGGHPSAIGTGSAIAVIIGGLFLLYRGLIDFRIPLIIVAADLAGLLILPVPPVLSAHTHWRWIVAQHADVGWATGITFANYELLASPALFMAFFLATWPSIRPMSRRARAIYAAMIGGGSAALQLYLSVSIGPYIALLLASLLTPLLDVWFRPRPLV